MVNLLPDGDRDLHGVLALRPNGDRVGRSSGKRHFLPLGPVLVGPVPAMPQLPATGRTSTSMWPCASDPAAMGAAAGQVGPGLTVSVRAPNECRTASSSTLSCAAVGRFDAALARRRMTMSLR